MNNDTYNVSFEPELPDFIEYDEAENKLVYEYSKVVRNGTYNIEIEIIDEHSEKTTYPFSINVTIPSINLNFTFEDETKEEEIVE